MLIFLIVGIVVLFVLMYVFVTLLKRREKYRLELNEKTQDSRSFEAVVLDVNMSLVDGVEKRTVILQFRDEEQHKTIVHRYALSHKNGYSRGDKVMICYNEADDLAIVYGDNPYNHKGKMCLIFAFVVFLISLVLLAAIVITAFWMLFMKH